MEDVARYRTESRRGWGSVAGGWEAHCADVRAAFTPVAVWMLDAARLQPGARVLELAAGTGEVGLMAHELIQPGGELILSDFAPEMLNVAQRAAEGLDGVRFKQIDIESIDVAAASQDAVLCRWGLMFLPDPETGVREVRRVLKPGGRFATAAWTGPEENQWSAVIGRVLVDRGHAEPSDPDAPGQFALAREGLLQELLESVGFVDDIVVEPFDVVLEEPSFDVWWSRSMAMSRSGELVRRLSAPEREAVEAELRERVAEYADGEGVLRLPGRTWVAAATA
ncbi:MAG: methyltransferase domain-containing protein [Solirubrobacteraceae bacterium]